MELSDLLHWATPKAHYFDVMGAAIVLVSWVVTNTISNRLSSAKSALDRATSDDELRQRLHFIRRGYREVKMTVTRLDKMLSEMNPDSIFSSLPKGVDGVDRNAAALVDTAQTSFFEHEDLQEIVGAIRHLTSAGEFPRALNDQLEAAVRDADGTLDTYLVLVRRWDEQRKRSIEMVKAGEPNTKLFQEATSDYVRAAVPLHEHFFAHREKLLTLHGQALGFLAMRLNRLKRAHRFSERTSWVLYAVGTSLAIVGKWLETMQKAA